MTGAEQPSLFPFRRIEFHLARRPWTGVPLSSGDFHLETLTPDNEYKGRATTGSIGGPCETGSTVHEKKSSEGEFHENGFDPELNCRISFHKIGAGLENLGNTCYLNSVLQCLTYTEPFAAYLQSGKHKSTCRAAGFCAMCALQNHVLDALRSTGKILKPFHLVRNLRCISRSFRNSRQEDAHEYMVNLLESMHKCCLPYGVSSESPSAYEKSLVHKIFGGQLRSQVKCMQCSYCSNTFDPFLDLSLEIVGADSLRKALAHFTASEQLDDGDRLYQCQRCKGKVRAFKQLTIHKAPYILTIHLKRFGSFICGEKINKKVEFGPTLDLKPFVSGLHEEELKYTLYGVLVHAGWSTHSGHYFCYVRTSAGLWYSLDDNHVSQVSEKTVLSREAYMLFYVRDKNTIKRPIEVNHKTATYTNSTASKGTPLDMPIYSSAMVRHDVIHGHLLKNQETPIFQAINSVVPNGFCKKMLPEDTAKILVSVNSKPPFCRAKNGNTANPTAQEAGTNRIMETNCMLRGSDDKCSSTINGPIMDDTGIKFMAVETIGCNVKKCSTSQQCQKCRAESPAVPEIENLLEGCRKPATKLKKSKVPFQLKGLYFGRKQLFLLSLKLHKKYKKISKKQHQSYRNKKSARVLDLRIDAQGTSTSKMYRADENNFASTSKKCKGEKGVKSGIDSDQTDNKEFLQNCALRGMLGTTGEPSLSSGSTEGQQNVKFKNDKNREILSSCPPRLLKESLREAAVAKWDAENVIEPRIDELENASKRKNGYLLDEWDEEYDRGKRKKLKSRQWFNGPNLFQEMATLKHGRR